MLVLVLLLVNHMEYSTEKTHSCKLVAVPEQQFSTTTGSIA
jgi:hypothetical protein